MKKIGLIDLLQLQGAVIAYSLSTVVANIASGYKFLSLGYIGFYSLVVVILGIYAVIWQQMIKKFQLSIAYANKALTLLWAMVWNYVIFRQGITLWKVVGVIIVGIGVMIMNLSEAEEQKDDK